MQIITIKKISKKIMNMYKTKDFNKKKSISMRAIIARVSLKLILSLIIKALAYVISLFIWGSDNHSIILILGQPTILNDFFESFNAFSNSLKKKNLYIFIYLIWLGTTMYFHCISLFYEVLDFLVLFFYFLYDLIFNSYFDLLGDSYEKFMLKVRQIIEDLIKRQEVFFSQNYPDNLQNEDKSTALNDMEKEK